MTNVWDDNGVSRYGAKGQIGGTLEYVNHSGVSYVSPLCAHAVVRSTRHLCGLWWLNPSKWRVFSFVKPQGRISL